MKIDLPIAASRSGRKEPRDDKHHARHQSLYCDQKILGAFLLLTWSLTGLQKARGDITSPSKMVSQKRALDDSSTSQKAKKRKGQDGEKSKDRKSRQKDSSQGKQQQVQPLARPAASLLNAEEIDFPRGGGSSLTALEVKAIRAEGAREAEELFKVSLAQL
jgi:hypothetical protein